MKRSHSLNDFSCDFGADHRDDFDVWGQQDVVGPAPAQRGVHGHVRRDAHDKIVGCRLAVCDIKVVPGQRRRELPSVQGAVHT
jgi:hypothetical protein